MSRDLGNWTPRPRPGRGILEGRHVRLEPLSAARHGDALFRASSGPDAAGRFRYLFEHRFLSQLELYRRMLYWMASFWQAAGREYLGQSASALAEQLSDAQHSVPSHPFTVELITRSLLAAQANLDQGNDPRQTPRLPKK